MKSMHLGIVKFAAALALTCVSIASGQQQTKPRQARQETAKQEIAASSRPSQAEVDPAEIENLIEQLAISQEPAGQGPILTPRGDTPPTDRRMMAIEAARKLHSYGRAAFPYLVKHLDDNRQSMYGKREVPQNVGGACFFIIERQIHDLPDDYPASLVRTGADGKHHSRPIYSGTGVFTHRTVGAWLKERENKSLTELRIEALEWLIAEDKRIGFETEKDRKEYLGPLERHLVRLQELNKKEKEQVNHP